jgi:antitoxin component of RelBE/YafQ-DinJ toxin-antitoxin module
MKKQEEKILIRIQHDVKVKLNQKAQSLGLSLSAYLRLLIIQDLLK